MSKSAYSFNDNPKEMELEKLKEIIEKGPVIIYGPTASGKSTIINDFAYKYKYENTLKITIKDNLLDTLNQFP